MKREYLHFTTFFCLLISSFLAAQTADLALELSSDQLTYVPESEIEFTLELSNSGDSIADAEVLFFLPNGTSLLGLASTNGSYLSQTGIWQITQFAPNSSVQLRIRAYNFNTTAPINAFAQLIQSSLVDPDSTPNNNVSGIAEEDDEAALIIFPTTTPTQVELLAFPENEQLYPRKTHNNLGLINIEGIATAGQSYTAIRAKFYRENVFQEVFLTTLNYLNDTAYFQISIPILAELADYSVELYGVNAQSEEDFIKAATELVAGDVYIINGQSNAQANVAPYFSDNRHFARAYTIGSGWINAQFAQPGPGQWGARMAAEIIENQGIPVAIFNEAVGGMRIDFYLKDEENPDEGNYGKLFRRLEAAGVREQVRAGFWFQGEADGWMANEDFLDTYKTKFISIHRAWLADYAIEKCYIFQVRYQSCLHLFPYVMEAQRQLQHELPNVATMSTTNTAHDSCHYYYQDGYEVLGNRVYRLMASELYAASDYNVAAPDIRRAYFSGERELTIELRDVQGELIIVGNPWQEFKLEGTNVEIIEGRAEGTRIILTLSEKPAATTGISYYAHVGATPPWVLNDAEVGLLTFYNHPIENLVGEIADLEILLNTAQMEYEQFNPFQYEVLVRNTSETLATNIEVEVPIPVGTAFSGSEVSGGRYLSWENRWLIDSIPANSNVSLNVNVFPLVSNETILAYAQITDMDQNDPDSTPDNGTQAQLNEDDEARLFFTPARQQLQSEETDLALTLYSDTQTYGIYQTVNYLLRIENAGEVEASNIEVNLDLSTAFAYTDHIASIGHYDNWNKIWYIPSLDNGETTELHLTLFTLIEEEPLRVAASLAKLDQYDNNETNDQAIWVITPEGESPQFRSRLGHTSKKMRAYPSLIDDVLQLEIETKETKKKRVLINDLQGRVVMQKQLDLEKGYNHFSINFSDLHSGVYLLRLEGETQLLKLVKN